MIILIGFGPKEWKKVSAHCSKSAQSPINIETSTVKKNSNLKGLRFTCDNIYGHVIGKMVNNGHAPTLAILRGTAKLTGGPLGHSVYQLQQIHFHFGCKDGKGRKGSEHTVNGKAYTGEVRVKQSKNHVIAIRAYGLIVAPGKFMFQETSLRKQYIVITSLKRETLQFLNITLFVSQLFLSRFTACNHMFSYNTGQESFGTIFYEHLSSVPN